MHLRAGYTRATRPTPLHTNVVNSGEAFEGHGGHPNSHTTLAWHNAPIVITLALLARLSTNDFIGNIRPLKAFNAHKNKRSTTDKGRWTPSHVSHLVKKTLPPNDNLCECVAFGS